MSKDVI